MADDLATYLPSLAIVFILLRRTQRSRPVRPKWLWIPPIILLVLGAAYAVGAVQKGAALTVTDLLIVVAAALLGGALGALRGSTLHLTRHSETGDIESKLSMLGLLVILVWMVGRKVLHQFGLEGTTTTFGVFNDAMLALAIASVTTRAIVLSRRCASLEAAPVR